MQYLIRKNFHEKKFSDFNEVWTNFRDMIKFLHPQKCIQEKIFEPAVR